MGAYQGIIPLNDIKPLQDATKDELSRYILKAEKYMGQVGPDGANYLAARALHLDALHEMRQRERNDS